MRSVGRLVLALVVALAGVLVGTATTPATAAYTTTPSDSWVPNGAVWDLTRAGDTIYIAGDFTHLSNASGQRVARNHVAALDAVTGEPLAWNPGANATVRAVEVAHGGRVYLGGDFTQVAGQPAERLAAVGSDGSLVPGWSASANDMVWRIATTPDAVYVAGEFGRIGGTQRRRVARLDPATGALVTSFNAQVDNGNRVAAMAVAADGESLYIGGRFTSLGGAARGFVGEVDADTGAATPWAPDPVCDTCYLFDLATDGDRVYGAMGGIGSGGRALAWSTAPGVTRSAWLHRADGDVQAIDVEDGVVYAAGHFGTTRTFDGHARDQLVAIQGASGAVTGYRLPYTGRNHPGTWAVLADATGLYIGGAFRLSPGQARYARMGYIVEPPSAPLNVRGTASGSAVTVSWDPPVSSGGGIDGYHVFVDPLGNFEDDRVCVTSRRSCSVPIGRDGLVEGRTYRFTVRAVNGSGGGTTSAPSDPVLADGSGPRVTIAGPRWRTTMSGSQVTWGGNDPSGVIRYQVAKRTGTLRKGYSRWTISTTTTENTTVLKPRPGRTVCTKVRGIDDTGNVGRWSRQVCGSAPVDDKKLRASGSVRRLSGENYYRSTVTRVAGRNSAVKHRKVRVSAASLVAWTCPRCGKLRVVYGGEVVRTVKLRSSTSRQKVVTLPRPGRAGRLGMTITLRPQGKRPVFVDGLALRPR